jgi:hypothetical protein
VFYVLFQSKDQGPGNELNLRVTGAPGDGTCANTDCHTSGSFDPTVTIELLDGANPVTEYEPGKTYIMRVTNTVGTGSPDKYGFQAVVLNSANQQAGNWGDPGAGRHTITIANRKYVEHSLPAVSNVFDVEWIAPAAGAGAVTFYSASVAAEENDNPSDDGMDTDALTIQEMDASNVSNVKNEYASITVLPNPVGELLTLKIISRTSDTFKLNILDTKGRVVKMEPLSVSTGVNHRSFYVSELTSGLYILQLCGDGHLTATQMLKR